jgi:class 3 adenylate cyclase/tetratricopeptide (TPR) repeat protein
MNCASPLEDAPQVREVRKTVTVVFCDVAGSTALGERLDPEALRRVMARYFDRMREVVDRHGGSVEKFIGDAVMAVFGLPVLHEDDALRAVRAAAEMRDALVELNRELAAERGVTLEVRMGVNTGEVVAGAAVREGTLATGDAVNTAARLEQSAPPGDILLGESTHRLVRDAVRVHAVEPLVVKGKADPLIAFRLLEVVPGAEAVPRRLDSPMVGRKRERDVLRLALERATEDRTCHLVTVLGSAGVGKSRLVEEFLGSIDATVLRGRCLPYGDGITFWPVREAIRQATGIGEDEPADEARAKLRVLCDADPRGDLLFQRVAQVLGLTTDSAVPEETFWAIRRLLEIVAGRGPLVVVFDDLHWGQPTFLDLVEHIADWTQDAALLVICLSRRELLETRPGWGGGKVNATMIQLEPLSEDDCAALIGNLLGEVQLAGPARDRIVEAAEGNPLFVEQMLAMMIDDELLRRDDGHWVPVSGLSDVAVPPTIQALLAARLDRLAGEERAVIERASVVGRVFYRDAVAELSPESVRPSVGEHLRTLVRRELIRPQAPEFEDETYRFRHLLIRDAAYAAMPKEDRAELHERFAAWLEARAGERSREYEEILGYHLERAHRYRAELGPLDDHGRELARRAGQLLGDAGLRASARGDVQGSIGLLTRAVSLLPEDDPMRVRLLPELAESLLNGAELGRAGEVLEEALDRAARTGDQRSLMQARIVGMFFRLTTDRTFRFGQALEDAEEILGLAEDLRDDELLVRAQEAAGALRFWTGRSEAAAELLEPAIARAKARGASSAHLTRLYGALSGCAMFGYVPADRGLETWYRILDEVSGTAEADARGVLAALHAMRGHFDEARSHLDRCLAIYRELGSTLHLAAAQVPYLVEMSAGDAAAAEARMREGVDLLREAGETGFLSTSAANLAEAMYAQGKFVEAEEYSRLSEDNAAPDDVASQVQWRMVRGKLLARQGVLEDAERLALEAVTIAEGMDYYQMLGDALMDLAEVLRLAERPADAAAAAERAIDPYERKGHVVAVGRARAFAEELRASR